MEYIFVSPTSIKFKMIAEPYTPVIMGIRLGNMVISIPGACINSKHRFDILRCALGAGFTKDIEIDDLKLINSLMVSIENSPYMCETLAYIYQLLEGSKICRAEFASILSKAYQYLIDHGTKTILQLYPRIPERKVLNVHVKQTQKLEFTPTTPMSLNMDIEQDLSYEYTYILEFSPRKDTVVSYLLSLIYNLDEKALTHLCHYSIDATIELIRTLEKTTVLTELISNEKIRSFIINTIYQHIDKIENSCYRTRNNENDALLHIVKEKLSRRCNIDSPHHIEALARKSEEIYVFRCIDNITRIRNGNTTHRTP